MLLTEIRDLHSRERESERAIRVMTNGAVLYCESSAVM